MHGLRSFARADVRDAATEGIWPSFGPVQTPPPRATVLSAVGTLHVLTCDLIDDRSKSSRYASW